jgi:hypothetical protein
MTQFGACSFSAAFRCTYKFTGKERDTESGLDMFGARYYGSLVPQVRAPVLGANLGGACPDVTAFPRARALDWLG